MRGQTHRMRRRVTSMSIRSPGSAEVSVHATDEVYELVEGPVADGRRRYESWIGIRLVLRMVSWVVGPWQRGE